MSAIAAYLVYIKPTKNNFLVKSNGNKIYIMNLIDNFLTILYNVISGRCNCLLLKVFSRFFLFGYGAFLNLNDSRK